MIGPGGYVVRARHAFRRERSGTPSATTGRNDRIRRLAGQILHWRMLGVVFAMSICLLGAPGVAAQAVPEQSDPPMNQAVPVMPSTIEIWFSEAVKPESTTMQVLNSEGARVDLDDIQFDLLDPSHPLVTVGVHPGLDNGIYVVQWTSVSAVDGSAASGSYQFVVDPAASPQALPQVATQQASVPLTAADIDDESEPGDRNPVLYGILAVVTGLALLGVLLFWFFRRPARGRRWRDDVVDRL